MEKLLSLKNEVFQAKQAMKAAMKKRWPINSKVMVKLKYNQTELTPARVIDHDGDGIMMVKILTSKENSRRKFRNVYFNNVFKAVDK